MYSTIFFSKDIFNCMVVVATTYRKYQELGFGSDDYMTTKEAFKRALDCSFPGEDIKCPPIVHIAIRDSPGECLRKIKGALVRSETFLPLKFSDNTCTLCSVKIRCSKENDRVAIIHADGTTTSYAKSKCHPFFVQKHNGAAKFFGGLAHVLTLGMGLWVKNWPGFTNSEEVCAACREPPGAPGCRVMGTRFTMERRTVKVDHSNKL